MRPDRPERLHGDGQEHRRPAPRRAPRRAVRRHRRARSSARRARRVPDLWREEGEAAFRAREGALVAGACSANATPRVIAFGGGTVTTRAHAALALDRALVVTLTASAGDDRARASATLAARPNLAVGGDPVARARELLAAARADAYAECHLALSTDALDAGRRGRRRSSRSSTRDPLLVPLGSRSYAIDVCDDEPSRLTDAVARCAPSSVVLVTDSNVQRARGAAIEAALRPLAVARITRVTLPPGEAHKTLASVATIWDAALGAGVDRDALVVAAGGGVVGRPRRLRGGLPAPRRALRPGADDAALDGRLVGRGQDGLRPPGRQEPRRRLPPAERRRGRPRAPRRRCRRASAPRARRGREDRAGDRRARCSSSSSATQRRSRAGEPGALIARRARGDRGEDPRSCATTSAKSGPRALLNLGHTVGHALEAHGGYARWLHGEAVALGTVAEMRATAALGWTPARARRARRARCSRRSGCRRSVGPARAGRVVAVRRQRQEARPAMPSVFP